MTRAQARLRLRRVADEYDRALAEVLALPPAGNGLAGRDALARAVAALYLPTILALERKLQRLR